MDAHAFITDLAVVLCTAAVVTLVFQKLRQPVVLGYVLAGMVVGPYVPIPLVASSQTVSMLSELGVILLMFGLGLEFSLQRLATVLPTAGLAGVVEMGLMMLLGSTAASLMGLSAGAQLFVSGMLAFSSTMVIARVMGPVEPRLKDAVFGVLVLEDLAAIVSLTVLTGVAQGMAVTRGMLVETLGKLVLFLVVMVVAGMALVPRLMRAVLALHNRETTLVASVGMCFAASILAQELGYSVALGAFLTGSLMAQAGAGHAVDRVVAPLRDLFGAIFFVSVGMLVDPAAVWVHRTTVLALVVTVVVGKVVGNTVGALLGGQTLKIAVQAGMSMAQIGEFGFILAALGQKHGVLPPHMFAVIVAVSVVTTGLTPPLMKASTPVALWLDARMPRPVQTMLTLHATWLARLRGPTASPGARARPLWRRQTRRLGILVVNGALMVGLCAATAWAWQPGLTLLEGVIGGPQYTRVALMVTAALVLGVPLVFTWLVVARGVALGLAAVAFPSAASGSTDLAQGPRRALTAVLHLAVVLATGMPIMAFAAPFLPLQGGTALLVAAAALLGGLVWRDAARLQGHVRAGAQVAAELLKPAQAHPTENAWEDLLPGLGDLKALRVEAGSPAEGRTLAQLNVRGLTGATVVAVRRGEDALITPTGHESLRSGDVLALLGSPAALEDAQRLLAGPPHGAAGTGVSALSAPTAS